MFGKYSPAQLAKSIAAVLTGAAAFIVILAGALAGLLPPEWIAGLSAVGVLLTGWAAYLTKSAPTLEQVEAHIDDVVALVKQVRPGLIPPRL